MTDFFPYHVRAGCVALLLALAACATDPAMEGPKPDAAAPEGRYSGMMLPQFPNCGTPSPARLQVMATGKGLDFRFDPFQGGQTLVGEVLQDGTLRVNMGRTAGQPGFGRAGDMGPMSNAPILEAQIRPQAGISSVSGTLRTGTCRWSFTLRKG